MSMDLNREQKRHMKKAGALDAEGKPVRAQGGRQGARRNAERTSPKQYISEVRSEMRKVAWPTWPEVRRYSLVVLATVVVIMALVFGFDYLFNLIFSWLYESK
jgi:preprotein translocase subunit SecE